MNKKVLIVVNLAGFLTFLWNDIKTLTNLGYEVHIAGNGKMQDGTDAIEIPKLNKMKISFYHINFDTKSPITKQNLEAYYTLKKLINKEKFDLVHCHTPIVGVITRLAAQKSRKKGTKVIYTTHGFTFTDKSSKKAWLIFYNMESFASRLCDAIITINNEDFKNAKKMHCDKVYIIPGVGVDTKKFKNIHIDRKEYREKINVNEDDIMILSVGELSARKNHEIIVSAIGKIPNHAHYVYVICGREVVNSGMAKHLKTVAKENKVKLILAGHRSDIPEMNKCADLAAIPSIREGLGLAGIEALSSGIPVIGSDVQGIREYINNGINGYLYDPYSADEFSKALQKTIKLKEKEQQLEQICYNSSRKFDISNSIAHMNKIYREILEIAN